MRWWWKAIQEFGRISCAATLQLRVYGREHIPARGGAILASNHQSYLDPLLLAFAADREIHFIARRSLFEIPLFRSIITLTNAFPVERDFADVGAVKEALRRLEQGNILLTFPEGTRTRDGKIGRVKGGIAVLAQRAGVPIIPALIQGAFSMWPRKRFLPLPCAINIMFARPLRVEKSGLEGTEQMLQKQWDQLSQKQIRRIEWPTRV